MRAHRLVAALLVLALTGVACGTGGRETAAGVTQGEVVAAPPPPSPTPVPPPRATPSPSPPAQPTPASTSGLSATAPFAPGSWIKVGSVLIALNAIIDPFVGTNQFAHPNPGERWVILDVTIANDGTDAYEFNALFDWKVKDADTFTYPADGSASTAASPFLSTGKLAAKGDQARGMVGFALRAGVVVKTVQFQSIASTDQGKFE